MRLPTDKAQLTKSSKGYFRIGHVVLDIPPEDILTNRVVNNDEVTPLRGQFPMYVKTGQSRWDVTVRWTALVNEGLAVPDYSQWEDLRHILAIFKAAPFVEVENGHLRQVFAALDPTLDNARLAFGLRQLRIETHADIVNALQCTLTMTLFNFYPYSQDFAYRGAKGPADKTDAYLSPDFLEYINKWIEANLDHLPEPDDVSPQKFGSENPWKLQEPGSLKFKWRLYRELGYQQGTIPTPLVDKVEEKKKSRPSTTIDTKGKYDLAILRAAEKYQIEPALLKAILTHEGANQPLALQPNLPGVRHPEAASVAKALRNRILHDSDGGVAAVEDHKKKWGKYPDLGLAQVNWGTGKRLRPNARPVDFFDPSTNVEVSAQYIRQDLFDRQGVTAQTIYAYNTGSPKKVFRRGNSKGYVDSFEYRDAVLRLRDKYALQIGDEKAPTPAPTPSTPVIAKDLVHENAEDLRLALSSIAKDRWQLDHYTSDRAFFFKEFDIALTDETHGDETNLHNMFPQGFVILFVNNLAQIPLQGYQYPTYQHVGPATTMVSLGILSVGDQVPNDKGELPEPVHTGIQELNFMSHQLEEQFQRMRCSWRSQRSVYRMQAVRVSNQILNMLGIYGLMLKDVTTATVPESSNLLSINLTANQYENVFEELDPYRVVGPKDAYKEPFQKYLMGDDIDKDLTDDEKATIRPLLNYRDARRKLDLGFISGFIQDKDFTPKTHVALPFEISPTDKKALLDVLTLQVPDGVTSTREAHLSGLPMKPAIQGYDKQVDLVRSGIGVYEVLWLDHITTKVSQEGSRVSLSPISSPTAATRRALDSVLTRLRTDQEGKKALDQFYEEVLQAKMAKDPAFRNALDLVASSPSFQNIVKGLSPLPGRDNPDHGAYRDLGLRVLTLGGQDLNPGMYFVDYSNDLDSAMRDGVEEAVRLTRNASDVTNKTDHPQTTVITNSDPVLGNPDDLKYMLKVPEFKMAAAFPTFKLFLLEEDNGGVFYALDDFYSYSTVTDIEIIKYRDRPHQAIIEITNLANLLSHKLFDNTAAGRNEKRLRRFDKIHSLETSDGVAAGPTTSTFVQEGIDGENYMLGKDMSDVVGKDGKLKTPLQLFALQPGTKIEVRMGFSNNPDELVRVFSGTVAEIEGDQIMRITAQGFQAELMTTPAEKIDAGGFLNNIATLRKGGARFGGLRLWGDSGDSATVIKKMLESASARHFGHWQVGVPSNPYLKGFSWSSLVGSTLSIVPGRIGSVAAPLLQTGYDRSGDNILINQLINHNTSLPDDSPENRGARGYFNETPLWHAAPKYHIPEGTDKTSWDYIKDVSRRYPEYNLLVRDYGFPFGCDATLVFAHPRDFYYSRPQHFDESRLDAKINSDNKDLFRAWWENRGRSEFRKAAKDALELAPYLMRSLVGAANLVSGNTIEAAIERIDTLGVTAFNQVLDEALTGTATKIFGFLAYITPSIVIDEAKIVAMRASFLRLQRSWLSYRDVRVPNKTYNSVLEPVRKYHFVDHQAIIHNGIVLNDQIFNAVRILGKLIRTNENVPDQYTRVLNADDLIIEPKDNVEDQALTSAYAQSFLKEEVGKMYRGELILAGRPAVDPGDVIILADPSMGMTGPIEVDSVIHSFNQEQGYITIVKPRLYISINEAASQEWIKRVGLTFWTMASNGFGAAVDELSRTDAGAKIGLAWNIGATGVNALVVNALLTRVGLPTAMTVARSGAVALGIGSGKALLVTAMLAVAGFSFVIAKNGELNQILISPLNKFGRPWIGGLEGYEVGDWFRLIHNEWKDFFATEIEPIMESFRTAMEYYNSVG